jgi:hypothetical protein
VDPTGHHRPWKARYAALMPTPPRAVDMEALLASDPDAAFALAKRVLAQPRNVRADQPLFDLFDLLVQEARAAPKKGPPPRLQAEPRWAELFIGAYACWNEAQWMINPIQLLPWLRADPRVLPALEKWIAEPTMEVGNVHELVGVAPWPELLPALLRKRDAQADPRDWKSIDQVGNKLARQAARDAAKAAAPKKPAKRAR